MEALPFSNSLSYQRHWDPMAIHDHRHRSPRLLTPEKSASSYAAQDDETPRAAVREGAPSQKFSNAPVSNGCYRDQGQEDENEFERLNSQQRSIPHSPPFHTPDMQRPSLPPLRTILGDKLSSPPQTPYLPVTSVLPAPREPVYTPTIYKPISLYPYKKQKADYVAEPTPSLTTASSLSSPGLLPAKPDLQSSPISNRRLVSAHAPAESAGMYPTSHSLLRHPSNPYQVHAYQSARGPPSPHYFRTSDAQTPLSCYSRSDFSYSRAFDGPLSTGFGRDSQQGLSGYYEHTTPRRTPTNGYDDYPSREYDRKYSRRLSIPPESRYQLSTKADVIDSSDAGRMEPRLTQLHTDFTTHGPYQSNQSPYFLPSHYDYQHGKARKRSNLPKQSTEIMKSWFEDNIANPYPSEEQKALFSNATGISMTQVSNWFINHRRRCPVLRDQRERTRVRDEQ